MIFRGFFITILSLFVETYFVNTSSVEKMSPIQSHGVVPDIIDIDPPHPVHVL